MVSGLFSTKPRAADVVALSSGYIGTMLYSELELLAEAHPSILRAFNLAMAKGALEERLAETGLSLDDLTPEQLGEEVNDLLALQAAARWKARHAELQAVREGLYADLYAEKEATALGADRGRHASIKGIFAKAASRAGQAIKGGSRRSSSRASRRDVG